MDDAMKFLVDKCIRNTMRQNSIYKTESLLSNFRNELTKIKTKSEMSNYDVVAFFFQYINMTASVTVQEPEFRPHSVHFIFLPSITFLK